MNELQDTQYRNSLAKLGIVIGVKPIAITEEGESLQEWRVKLQVVLVERALAGGFDKHPNLVIHTLSTSMNTSMFIEDALELASQKLPLVFSYDDESEWQEALQEIRDSIKASPDATYHTAFARITGTDAKVLRDEVIRSGLRFPMEVVPE